MSSVMGYNRTERRVLAKSIRGQTQSKWNSYYSKVRFETTLGSSIYSIASGLTSRAFSYGVGADMSTAGFATVKNTATFADTNIQTANQTVAGETVLIKGIGIILCSHSDAALAKQADAFISVKAILNANMIYPLGIPSMVPGPGGLTGISDAPSVFAMQLSVLERVGGMTNGLPIAGNFFPFPEPLVWRSAGNGDSAFNVQFFSEYQIQTYANYGGTTRAAVVGGTTNAASGVAAYTPPTATHAGPQWGTVLDYMCVIVGRTVNPLSDN
jgi:hypothetical protein